MSKSNDPPPAPDPAQIIQLQSEANRISRFGPQGNVLFGSVGPQGQFVQGQGAAQFVQESPFQQSQRGIQEQMAVNLGNLAGAAIDRVPTTPFSYSGLPALPTDLAADAQAVEDATFQRAQNLLNPVFARQEEALRTRLANQGLPQGGEAFGAELDIFNRARNEALSNAALEAIGAGRAEQSRLFNLGLSGRRQLGQEQAFQRALPFNELAALMRTTPVAQPPQFAPAGAVDVMGPYNQQYAGQLAGFNAANQQRQGLLGGLLGLGGALGGAYILRP